MRTYPITNVDNLRLFEIFDGEEEEQILHTMEDFSLNALEESEDTFLQKNI
jgi:hypothetical protein